MKDSIGAMCLTRSSIIPTTTVLKTAIILFLASVVYGFTPVTIISSVSQARAQSWARAQARAPIQQRIPTGTVSYFREETIRYGVSKDVRDFSSDDPRDNGELLDLALLPDSEAAYILLKRIHSVKEEGELQQMLGIVNELLETVESPKLPLWSRIRPFTRFSRRARKASLRHYLNQQSKLDAGVEVTEAAVQKKKRQALLFLLEKLAVEDTAKPGLQKFVDEPDRQGDYEADSVTQTEDLRLKAEKLAKADIEKVKEQTRIALEKEEAARAALKSLSQETEQLEVVATSIENKVVEEELTDRFDDEKDHAETLAIESDDSEKDENDTTNVIEESVLFEEFEVESDKDGSIDLTDQVVQEDENLQKECENGEVEETEEVVVDTVVADALEEHTAKTLSDDSAKDENDTNVIEESVLFEEIEEIEVKSDKDGSTDLTDQLVQEDENLQKEDENEEVEETEEVEVDTVVADNLEEPTSETMSDDSEKDENDTIVIEESVLFEEIEEIEITQSTTESGKDDSEEVGEAEEEVLDTVVADTFEEPVSPEADDEDSLDHIEVVDEIIGLDSPCEVVGEKSDSVEVHTKRAEFAAKLQERQASVEEARNGENVEKFKALVRAQDKLSDKCFVVLTSLGLHDDVDDVPDPDDVDYEEIHGHLDKEEWSGESDFFWQVDPQKFLDC